MKEQKSDKIFSMDDVVELKIRAEPRRWGDCIELGICGYIYGRYPPEGVYLCGLSFAKIEEVGYTPDDYALFANYPNPFNPETNITFQIPKRCHVRLSVYNNLGQLIYVLFDGELSAGIYNKTWHAIDMSGMLVSSGIYLYKLETKDFVQVRKMLYIQ